MALNLFEELNVKKNKLKTLAQKAQEYGWIDEKRKTGIIQKIDHDVLTIGVIGQMKCGKSTFLNSFVFEDDVLPAATTPMTAALSVITYGEKKSLVAEFYSREEWEEQKLQASRSLDDVAGNELETAKVKAAKELVEKAGKLGSSLNSLLGHTQEDSFEHLEEYVGADGKYISITKSVKIFYPKEYLKGVEIVDTPGFNDPIVSREERTKAFLHKADVVLLMLYAGRPFDLTDRTILFKNVRECGIGKVIIGINKYDIPYENGESEDEIKAYVKAEIEKACRDCDDNNLVDLLKDTEPIPLSAEMALLSELPMSKITASDTYQFSWKRACDNFEISSQPQMKAKSHIEQLTAAVKDLVEKQKADILFAKPLNAIRSAAHLQEEKMTTAIRETKDMVQNLSIPDDELEEKLRKLEKGAKRMNKRIDNLSEDLDFRFKEIMRKGEQDLEDNVDSTCNLMNRDVDSWGRFQSSDIITQKLDDRISTLITRTFKRTMSQLNKTAVTRLDSCLNDFFSEVEDVLIRFIPDVDQRELIQETKRSIDLEIDGDFFKVGNSNDEGEPDYGLGDAIFDFVNGASFGIFGKFAGAVGHGGDQAELRRNISQIKTDFDPSNMLNALNEKKETIIRMVHDKFIEHLFTPMQENIQNIQQQTASREQLLLKKEEELNQLTTKQKVVAEQIESIGHIMQ